MLSAPKMGSLAPGATGAPLQPSDKPSGAPDAIVRLTADARARRGRLREPEAGSEVQVHAARTDDSMRTERKQVTCAVTCDGTTGKINEASRTSNVLSSGVVAARPVLPTAPRPAG